MAGLAPPGHPAVDQLGIALGTVLRSQAEPLGDPGQRGQHREGVRAADHIQVLDMALASLPAHARPIPGDPGGPRVLFVHGANPAVSAPDAGAVRERLGSLGGLSTGLAAAGFRLTPQGLRLRR